MTLDQQEDLGVLALSALRYSMGRETQSNSITICGAIAHMVPYLAESDMRLLIHEIEVALSKYGTSRHEWVDLLTVLRRLDRP